MLPLPPPLLLFFMERRGGGGSSSCGWEEPYGVEEECGDE